MGALTSKPYAFVARSWELTSIDTIDIMDAVGSQLMFFVRDENVVRVLPRVFNFFTSVEWITDKARFFYDALRRGRVTYPFFKFRGFFVRICFNFVYSYIQKMSCASQKKASLTFGLSPFVDVHTSLLVRDISFLFSKVSYFLGYEEQRVEDQYNCNYIMNLDDVNIERFDTFLFLFTNPRFEAPPFYLRMRALSRKKKVYFLSLGVFQSFFDYNLGASIVDFLKLVTGKSLFALFFIKRLLAVVIGMSIYQREDYKILLSLLSILREKLISNVILVNLLVSKIASVGLSEVGVRRLTNFKIRAREEFNWLFLLGYNSISCNISKFSFILALAHHGSDMTLVSDMIIPALTPYEQAGLFVNMEGRYLKMSKVLKKSSAYGLTFIHFLWQFFCLKFFMLFLLRSERMNLKYFFSGSRIKFAIVFDVYYYFLQRLSFLLPSSKNEVATLPNRIENIMFGDVFCLRIKLNNTSCVSYHRFYHTFDIFSSNSFSCLLAYRRFRGSAINY